MGGESTMAVLESKRLLFQTKFLSLGNRALPQGLSSREAEIYRLGLKQGYGEGLKDGVTIGIDVNFESAVVSESDFS